MNLWKPLALASTSALILVVGYQAASAGPAPAPAPTGIEERQPNMEAALASLQSAHASLQKAEHDKGGWRAAAARATETAIAGTKRGIVFDNKH
jgi:hypothetical protein